MASSKISACCRSTKESEALQSQETKHGQRQNIHLLRLIVVICAVMSAAPAQMLLALALALAMHCHHTPAPTKRWIVTAPVVWRTLWPVLWSRRQANMCQQAGADLAPGSPGTEAADNLDSILIAMRSPLCRGAGRLSALLRIYQTAQQTEQTESITTVNSKVPV